MVNNNADIKYKTEVITRAAGAGGGTFNGVLCACTPLA